MLAFDAHFQGSLSLASPPRRGVKPVAAFGESRRDLAGMEEKSQGIQRVRPVRERNAISTQTTTQPKPEASNTGVNDLRAES